LASFVPGGTAQPIPPASGGVREPLQYWLANAGFDDELPLPVPT